MRNGSMVDGCVGEQTADVRMSTPQVMADHLTAAEVTDLNAEMTTALVRLEQRRIRIRTEILPQTHTQSTSYFETTTITTTFFI